MNFNILLLFLSLFSSVLSASVIQVSQEGSALNITNQVEIYVQKDKKVNFDYVKQNSSKLFTPSENDQVHLGYSSDTVWLKFSFHNDSSKEIQKILEISNDMLDYIFLYTKNSDGIYMKQKKGVMEKREYDDGILRFHFNLQLKKDETKEYYLKVSSLSCAMYFEVNVMNVKEFYIKEMYNQLVLVLFFGTILSLIIYNFFIYVFTKEIAYFYYILYLFFTAWTHLSYSGIIVYVLPQELWRLDAYFAIYYLAFILIFAILFTREFLNIKKYKRLDFGLKINLGLNIVVILITLAGYYPIEEATVLFLFSFCYVVATSLYSWFKGVTNARYIVIGWSIALFGWVMMATKQHGLWTLIDEYPYFYEFTIFTEAILFSIALASKLNTTNELERSVTTNEVLTRELHHRVKNNMQFIISMYRLKLAKYTDSNISDSLKEVEGTIQAMSATHEMLYSQKVVSYIDTKEYFTTLTQRLGDSYKNATVKINLDISCSLDIDSSIYVGIILNELVTNSFKYAFTDKRGEINIHLSKKNTKYMLVVQDNGGGFDISKSKDSFGLELVETLVIDELNGILETNARDGVVHTIKW